MDNRHVVAELHWKDTEAHETNALIKFVLQPANSPDTNLNDLCFFRSLSSFSTGVLWTSFGTSLWSNTMHSMAANLRDAGASKPRSITSSTQKERIITSYRTGQEEEPVSRYFLTFWTIGDPWRELWTTKVCMPHSLLLDKFMLPSCDPPRFAMSCNSTKKTRKKRPL